MRHSFKKIHYTPLFPVAPPGAKLHRFSFKNFLNKIAVQCSSSSSSSNIHVTYLQLLIFLMFFFLVRVHSIFVASRTIRTQHISILFFQRNCYASSYGRILIFGLRSCVCVYVNKFSCVHRWCFSIIVCV